MRILPRWVALGLLALWGLQALGCPPPVRPDLNDDDDDDQTADDDDSAA